jgi:hypothetical protein
MPQAENPQASSPSVLEITVVVSIVVAVGVHCPSVMVEQSVVI